MAERKQLTEVIDQAIRAALAALPQNVIAVVTAVNEKTINCKPVINRVYNGEEIEYPEFVEVPPVFLHGGTSFETYPLAVGDYCLLLISDRCFDLWYDGQDFRAPAEVRIHDYSDAFALVGLHPAATAHTIPEVITQIGDKYKEGHHEHVGDLTHTGNTTHDGDTTQTGNYDHDGDCTRTGFTDSGSYRVGGVAGWSGTFPVHDGRTVTVVHGLITDVQ